MDMPDDNIIDAFLHPEISDESIHNNDERAMGEAAIREGDVDIQLIEPPLIQHSSSSLTGAGDGLHNNNQPIWDENIPPFVIIRGRHVSKFWHYMPMLILLSNSIFKCILKFLGVEANSAALCGITYNTHFTVLQWFTLFVMYLFKA